jgi:[NiFe] hydrogenase diaphorase moiety large subunit
MTISQFTTNVIACFNQQPDMLLQMLIKIQRQYSFIPQQAITQLSKKCLLTEANILGVIGFYSFLHTEPRGSYDLRISNNITDQMLGSLELTALLCDKLAVQAGTPRKDNRVSVDFTSCTGMGDQGPAMLVNGQPVIGLNTKRIEKICQLIELNTPVKQWPTDFFKVKNNIQRTGILLADQSENGAALQSLLKQGAQKLLQQIESSNLRGRGGGGFKTGFKWRLCQQAIAEQRYVVCNADEGEPGTFKDRVLLSTQPDKVIEGMTLCAGIISAGIINPEIISAGIFNENITNTKLISDNTHQSTSGLIYLRGEYRYLHESLEQVLQKRRDAGLLGDNILGIKGFDFDIEIHLGAGAYI